MGIINNDSFSTRYGQDLSKTYISLGDNCIELRKEEGKYILMGIFNVWLSKESRLNNKSSFSSTIIRKELSASEITSNLYTILYTELKKKYTNTTDDL